MKKILWFLGIVIVALIIVVAVISLFYIGPIVKVGMEEVGPRVTKVSIKVDTVNVSLLSGSATIKGLTVGNPEGFTSPQAISVGTIAISLDPLSVTSNKIVIHSIHVESPEITYEGGLSSNNLDKILNNVSTGPQNGSSAATTGSSNKSASTVEVDDFLVTGAKIHVILPGLGNKNLMLPDIHLTNLGNGGKGLTPVELTRLILDAIVRGTLNTVTGSVTDIAQGVQSLGKDAGRTVGDSVSKITSSIGGLLGK